MREGRGIWSFGLATPGVHRHTTADSLILIPPLAGPAGLGPEPDPSFRWSLTMLARFTRFTAGVGVRRVGAVGTATKVSFAQGGGGGGPGGFMGMGGQG